MTKFDFGQSSAFESPEESPGFLLWRASTLWRRSIESALKPLGMTHPQFVILATVGWLTKSGLRASQAAIARQASLDPNTTSQILRSLLSKGLIEKLHAADERSKHPVLTAAGAQALSKALPTVEEADALFFGCLNLSRTNALEALQKLAGIQE